MFDVDGTLVDSLAAEVVLYPEACRQGLGIDGVSGHWDDYANPTDRGIVEELAARRLGRRASGADFVRVEACFVALLERGHHGGETPLREVPGAAAAFAAVRALPDTLVAIATAGWRASARFKLRCAGIETGELPMATAVDAITKRDIIAVALERALRQVAAPRFTSATYVGDSNTDRRASAELGLSFIGIDTAGWVKDAPVRFADFGDVPAFVTAVQALQLGAR
jgi:phosphoglycolate phosphatase-like HAD superfamily hydrolase